MGGTPPIEVVEQEGKRVRCLFYTLVQRFFSTASIMERIDWMYSKSQLASARSRRP